MSGALQSRAETAKLTRLLEVEDQRALEFLLAVPAAELRGYREAVTGLFYDDERELLQRTADAARLLPARTAAAVGERALGPLICARLTGLLAPSRAIEISGHLTVDFLARLSAELDPRRAAEVVAGIAADTVVAVATAMAANGEHVAMERFVAHLDEPALRRCVEKLGDEDLLRVAFLTEDDGRLALVFEMAGAERASRVLAAARSCGLVEEAAHVAARLEPAREGAGARAGRRSPRKM